MDHAKNYAASCIRPYVFFCIEANGMCYRPDQFCDKDHQRIGECFNPEQSEAVHLQSCKDNHGNVSALKDPQCLGACSYRFNSTFIANEEPVDSNWELNGWFVVSCCLIGVIVLLACFCTFVCIWKRWKPRRARSHVPKPAAEDPDSGGAAEDPESGDVINRGMCRQLSHESQREESGDDRAGGDQPNTQQRHDEEVSTEMPLLTQDDDGQTLVNINPHQRTVSYNPAISTSRSNLSDGSNRREPSSDEGRSGSACAGNTPSSPASMQSSVLACYLGQLKQYFIK